MASPASAGSFTLAGDMTSAMESWNRRNLSLFFFMGSAKRLLLLRVSPQKTWLTPWSRSTDLVSQLVGTGTEVSSEMWSASRYSPHAIFGLGARQVLCGNAIR